MAKAEKLEDQQPNPGEPRSDSKDKTAVAAQDAVEAVIRRYTLCVLWPYSGSNAYKTQITNMTSEIAALFGRSVFDISLDDLGRAQVQVSALAAKVGLSNIKAGMIIRTIKMYEAVSPAMEIASHVYAFGSAFAGSFGPIIRKYGVKASGAPLARAAGVWFAGQVISQLYWDEVGYEMAAKKKIATPPAFDSMFDSFSLEHLRELAVYMGIGALVTWNQQKLRDEVLDLLKSSHFNKVVGLWSDVPSYKSLLLSLCGDLDIPGVKEDDSVERLEARVAQKVFADSIKNMTPEQLKEFERTVILHSEDGYWKDAVSGGLTFGTLAIGNMAGFGLYVAASSGLAALSQGLGITFAFSTYTTLSSALSVVFGPIGLGIAGVTTAFALTRARPKLALPFVLYMAVMRTRMEAESKSASRIATMWLRMRLRVRDWTNRGLDQVIPKQ